MTIDVTRPIFMRDGYIMAYKDGRLPCAINEAIDPEAFSEISAYLASHPEALVDEPKFPEPTPEQLALQEISVLKSNLLSTDFIPAKIGDALALGISTTELQEKYREKLLEREKWRIRIRELEGII